MVLLEKFKNPYYKNKFCRDEGGVARYKACR